MMKDAPTRLKIHQLTNSSLSQTLLYGNTLFDKEKRTLIFNTAVEYILSTENLKSHLSKNLPTHFIIFTLYFIVVDFFVLLSISFFLVFLNLFSRTLEFCCLRTVTFYFIYEKNAFLYSDELITKNKNKIFSRQIEKIQKV